MRRVDLPTAVDARFDQDGGVRVASFTWRQTQLLVVAAGRTWLDDDGRHLLVMVTGDRIYELVLRRSDLSWRVVGTPDCERLA
jgi:hypothetical protein